MMINKLEAIQNMLAAIRPFIDGYSKPPANKEDHQLTSVEMQMNIAIVLTGVAGTIGAAKLLKIDHLIVHFLIHIESELKDAIDSIEGYDGDDDLTNIKTLSNTNTKINEMLEKAIIMISAARSEC
jgi:hypothetical protein